MSMVVAARTQRRDKSANGQKPPQATAEQLRLAQIMSGNPKEEDKNIHLVEKVMEVTGTDEDNARTALYDANNDTNRAIELILENGPVEQNTEWETAGSKKKSKNTQNPKSLDTFDEDVKEAPIPPSANKWDRNESRGRGRGRNANRRRGKPEDHEKIADDDGKGAQDGKDRVRGGGMRRGRGRGGSYSNRGRQPGRPKRFQRFNRDRPDNKDNGGSEAPLDLDEGFGMFTNKATEAEEEWDNLEVGPWSMDDSKKQNEKKGDSFSEPWGTDSWADDLAKTKVFQSTHPQNPASGTPQMGERIDIDALFNKKTTSNEGSGNYNTAALGNNSLQSDLGYNANDSIQHTTSSVIQQLQGQSSSLFSESKLVGEMETSSRLFGSYDSQTSGNNAGTIGHYGTTPSSETYSQFNGKLESSERNTSSLLGSFADQFKIREKSVQSGMLGSGLNKSAFTPLNPSATSNLASSTIGSDYNNFSQSQQQHEATQAVKASLGLSQVGGNPHMENPTQGQTTTSGLDQQETLSFGEPITIRQNKTQRRKQPSSKIPAAAVEMPGSSGKNCHEMSNFDLQFGIDDNSIPSKDFGNPKSGVTPNSLFGSSTVNSQQGMLNHLPNAPISDSSMFVAPGGQQESRSIQRSSYQSLQSEFSQTASQLGGNSDTSHQPSGESTSNLNQRYSDASKTTEPLRGPPGLPHPNSLSSSSSSANGLGSLSAANQPNSDLSASGSYGSSRIGAGGNMALGGLSSDAALDPTSLGAKSHSFYASTSHGNQGQQQIGSDLANSAGRSLRSPVPTSSLQGSIQGSPMPSHISATPSKDDHTTGSTTSAISSLTSGLVQTHITPHSSSNQSTSQSGHNISGSITSTASNLGGTGTYGSINMHLPYSVSPQSSSQPTVPPSVSSPGKQHLTPNDLYSSSGLPSSLHPSHQQSSSSTVSSMIGSSLGGSTLSTGAGQGKTSASAGTTKPGPPNLQLGVPPLLPSQFGIPMAPGLMTAYAPELYGYTDPLMAVQSRVQMQPNFYDISSYHNSNNPTGTNSTNRESSATSSTQGKFGHRESSSPSSGVGMVGGSVGSSLNQQVANQQHSAQQLKGVSQTGTHQAQPFMNLPTGPAAAYPGYANVYYNAFQYPPVFAAATATVPQSGKHSVNATTAFQQHGAGYANAYSTASINATSANNLHDLQSQGFNKNHVSAFDKQAAFHHHTNTPPPPFNLQTLTAMAAANSGAAGGGAAPAGMSPYTQSPFMTMLPTPPSQIHLHVQQHGEVGQSVGSQRGQSSNPIGKSTGKPGFGQYWQN